MNPIEALRGASAAPRKPDPFKLRCKRELLELSQHDLGARLRWVLGAQTVSRLETYAIGFGRARCKSIALALGCDEVELQSSPEEWAQNRETFERWKASGLALREWLLVNR